MKCNIFLVFTTWQVKLELYSATLYNLSIIGKTGSRVKWSLTRGYKQWKYFKLSAQTVAAVAYERWSPTSDSNYSDYTEKMLVFWKSGR